MHVRSCLQVWVKKKKPLVLEMRFSPEYVEPVKRTLFNGPILKGILRQVQFDFEALAVKEKFEQHLPRVTGPQRAHYFCFVRN
jgi:hypothetical protein